MKALEHGTVVQLPRTPFLSIRGTALEAHIAVHEGCTVVSCEALEKSWMFRRFTFPASVAFFEKDIETYGLTALRSAYFAANAVLTYDPPYVLTLRFNGQNYRLRAESLAGLTNKR